MSCKDVGDLLHGYIDSELDLYRSLQIEEHLKDCPVCQRTLEEQQALRRAMGRSSLYAVAPEGWNQRVRSALHREGKSVAGVARAPWSRPLIWIPSTAAAAIMLFLVFFLLRPANDGLMAQEIFDAHVRSLQPGHLMDVQSSDQHTVKPWFAGKVDFAPPAKDLSASGFALAGGRLDYVGERPVAVMVYQRRKHVISLFIWPSGGADGGDTKSFSQNGYHLIRWVQGGMTFWAASDVNEADLAEFARLLRELGG